MGNQELTIKRHMKHREQDIARRQTRERKPQRCKQLNRIHVGFTTWCK